MDSANNQIEQNVKFSEMIEMGGRNAAEFWWLDNFSHGKNISSTTLYTPFGNGEGRGCSVCLSFDVRPSHHWNFVARMLQIYHHLSKIVTGLILITNSSACMPQIYHHWSKIVTGLILITNSAACMPQILPFDWLTMYTYIWYNKILITNSATCMPQILPLD
jgi:hypothetical protein